MTAGHRGHKTRSCLDLPRVAAGGGGGPGWGEQGVEVEEEEVGKRLHTVGAEAETLLRSRFDEN